MNIRRSNPLALIPIVAILTVGQTANGDEPPPPPPAVAATPQQVSEAKPPATEAVSAAQTSDIETRTAQGAAGSTVAAATPDPFAAQTRASFQDFLNLVSAAVEGIDESADGTSLTIRAVPLREGPLAIAGAVVLRKPVIYEPLDQALTADDRAAIEKGLASTDDVSYNLSFSLLQTKCKVLSTAPCFGRSVERYSDYFDAGLSAKLAILLKAGTPVAAEGHEGQAATLHEADLSRYADVLATLIDRQPQLALTGSRRVPARALGPSETAVNLEFTVGSCNLNHYRPENPGSDPAKATALLASALITASKDRCAFDRIVVSASCLRRDAFDGTWFAPTVGADAAAKLSTPSSSAFNARLQAGFTLAPVKGPRATKFDAVLLLEANEEDGVRTKSRAVFTGTLTVPLGETVAIPLVLTWANRPEYLGDVRSNLAAKVGLSWRLPWEPKAQ